MGGGWRPTPGRLCTFLPMLSPAHRHGSPSRQCDRPHLINQEPWVRKVKWPSTRQAEERGFEPSLSGCIGWPGQGLGSFLGV